MPILVLLDPPALTQHAFPQPEGRSAVRWLQRLLDGVNSDVFGQVTSGLKGQMQDLDSTMCPARRSSMISPSALPDPRRRTVRAC